MLWIAARRLRAGVQSSYTHKPHQTLHTFAIDLKIVVIPQVIAEPARAFERASQMQLIQLAHQIDVIGTDTCRFPVGR